jgi:hypothetical protein
MALMAEQYLETWLQLSEAAVFIDHDQQKARQRLERGITKAWLVPPPASPQFTLDPNVPLRIQVKPPAGLKIEGRAWLDNPVLDWEASEVECLCKPWTHARQVPSPNSTQCRARVEVWGADLVRLWGGNSERQIFAECEDTKGQHSAEARPSSNEIYGY